MAFTDINGITLHYTFTERGENAPVVVFINSLGTDFRIWLPVLEAMADGWSNLLYDKRGHGLSDSPGMPCSIDDHAEDLIGLCDSLGIERAILVGLSVGGMIAQSLCRKRPGLVEKMVLSNTAPVIGSAESWNARIDAVRAGGLASIADSVMEKWFTRAFREARPHDLAGYRNMLARQDVEGYIATCTALRDADLTAAAREIRVPVMAIAGDQDGSTPPDLVSSMANLVPGARFELIRACGHIPCVEQPEEMARLLAGFVNGN